jgi:hypothetical protein
MTAWVFSVLLLLAACLSCAGWGELVRRTLRLRGPLNERFLGNVWLGWAAVLVLLMAVHHARAIDGPVSLALLLAGLLLAAVLLPWRGWRRYAARLPAAFRRTVAGAVAFWALWIGYRALGYPDFCDVGLYYLNVIRWTNEFPLVPGLANLHGRFGFNNVNLLHAAWLNFFPWFGHGYSVAFGVCLLPAIAEGGIALLRTGCAMFRRGRIFPDAAAAALLLPLLVAVACNFPISAPVSDFFNIALLAVAFVRVCRMARRLASPDGLRTDVVVFAALAATSIAVKVSQIVVMPALGTVAAFLALRGHRMDLRRTGKTLACALPLPLALLALWLARGIFLSGYPLYPSVTFSAEVDWKVPAWIAQEEMNSIRAWARQPYVPWQQVFGKWDWLGVWFRTLVTNPVYWLLILLPLAALAGALLLAVLSPRRMQPSRAACPAALIWPLILGIAFWFQMAPSARFVGAQFWCLAAVAWVRLLDGRRLLLPRRVVFAALLAVLFLPVALGVALRPGQVFVPLARGFAALPVIPLKSAPLAPGVRVWTPVTGGECWDSPLPSTQRVIEGLSLRGPDLRSGFVIRAETGSPTP